MRFVTHTAKGVALDLPDTLRLIHGRRDRWDKTETYQLRGARPAAPPVLDDPDVWGSRLTEFIHEWQAEPTERRIFQAMRRDRTVPPDVAEEWGKRHEFADDVTWYRRRRGQLGHMSSMDDEQLSRVFSDCLREAIEREGDRLDREPDVRERLMNPLVGGRPLSMLDPLELDQLMVAIDWQRARGPA